MKVNNSKILIVKALADGEFHSGEELGRELGISRAAVANHIKSLTELGLTVFSVTGKGYRLPQKLTLLDAKEISSLCDNIFPLDVLQITPSTNEHLMQKLRSGETLENGYTVVSESQTQGRGRRGRNWQSPYASNLYLSQYLSLEDGLAAASGLSLAIGIAVLNTVNQYIPVSAKLKWPNDVLVNGKKLAGILVEAEGQTDGLCHLIIGIGLNIGMPDSSSNSIDQPWVDINQLTEEPVDRNKITATLLNELNKVIGVYINTGLSTLVDTWNANNAHAGQLVNIISATQVKQGRCLGIDNTGALLLEEPNNKGVAKFYGGEVSLRHA